MTDSKVGDIENLRQKWKNILDNEGGKVKVDSQVNLNSPSSSFDAPSIPPPVFSNASPIATSDFSYESSVKNLESSESSNLEIPSVTSRSSQSTSSSSSYSTLLVIGLAVVIIFALLLLWSTRSVSDEDFPQKSKELNHRDEAYSFEFEADAECQKTRNIQTEEKDRQVELKEVESIDREREDDLGKKSQRERVYGQIPASPPARSGQDEGSSKPNIRISNKNEDPLFQTLRQ